MWIWFQSGQHSGKKGQSIYGIKIRCLKTGFKKADCMGWLLYNLILHLGLLLLGPFLMIGLFFTNKRRGSVLERLGVVLPPAGKQTYSNGHIWIHALSVGEFRSAEPLINQLAEKYGWSRLVLTTSTVTGQKIAQQYYGNKVEVIGYFPYDIPWAICRVIRRINPQLVVLVESDLWPNFMAALNRRNIPIVWANARISAKSFKGYQRLKVILKSMFNQFDAIGTQTAADAEKLKQLGVSVERIAITGNIKFDQPVAEVEAGWIQSERQKLGWPDAIRVIVAGSTHEGEETQLLTGLQQLRRQHAHLGLIVVPRNPQRADAVVQMGVETGLKTHLYSMLPGDGSPPDVVVVDQMGLLRDLYALADIAFVGGSLVPFGGHNPIEPAAWGKPLLWGSHMHNFVDMANLFITHGAAHEIADTDGFTQMASSWLSDSEAAKKAGIAARKVVDQNRGSVAKIMEIIARFYDA